jgi:hypothetical protein
MKQLNQSVKSSPVPPAGVPAEGVGNLAAAWGKSGRQTYF